MAKQQVIDFLAAELDATTMSVEKWFETYGVAILKCGEAKRIRKARGAASGR